MKILKIAALLITVLGMAACSSGPELRSDLDPGTDFTRFKTYGFVRVTGTDQANYQTLVTQHFKSAVRTEMDARGYRFVESNPDLLVNFNAVLSEKVRVTSQPRTGMYYGYRGYGAWGGYGSYTDVRQYTQGTVNIDLIDASRQQLVWEGVAVGTVRESDKDEIRQRIAGVVAQIMNQYPFRAQAD